MKHRIKNMTRLEANTSAMTVNFLTQRNNGQCGSAVTFEALLSHKQQACLTNINQDLVLTQTRQNHSGYRHLNMARLQHEIITQHIWHILNAYDERRSSGGQKESLFLMKDNKLHNTRSSLSDLFDYSTTNKRKCLYLIPDIATKLKRPKCDIYKACYAL